MASRTFTEEWYEARLRSRERQDMDTHESRLRGATTRSELHVGHPRTYNGGVIEFCIPGEPFPWQRARIGENYSHHTPAAMRSHQRTVKSLAELAGCVPIVGPVKLEITCYRKIPVSWPDKKRKLALTNTTILPTGVPDSSNYLKEIEDALNKTAYRDDAQVVEAIVKKLYSDTPRTEVRITPLL